MQIDRIDHLVLTVSDIQITVNFYTSVLGMEEVTFGGGEWGLFRSGHLQVPRSKSGAFRKILPMEGTYAVQRGQNLEGPSQDCQRSSLRVAPETGVSGRSSRRIQRRSVDREGRPRSRRQSKASI